MIIQLLNTITNLYNTNQTNAYKNVYFPIWQFDHDGNPIANSGNAQDSNQEIMKTIARLLIFDKNKNQNYLHTISATDILPINSNIWNITYNSTDKLDIIFHKAMVMWCYHFLSIGNYKATYPSFNDPVFGVSCVDSIIETDADSSGESITEDHNWADYVSYSNTVYMYYYLSLFGMTTTTNIDTLSINGTKINNSNSGLSFSSDIYLKPALKNYIDWIAGKNKTGFKFQGTSSDDFTSQITRASYQITEILILINKGDVYIGFDGSTATTIWNTTIGMESYTKKLINIMKYLIDLERDPEYLDTLRLDYTSYGSDSYQNPFATINDTDTLLKAVQNTSYAYIHQLSYLIFLNLYNETFETTRTNTSNTTYMENSTIDKYFGFNNDISLNNNLTMQANTWANNKSDTTSNKIFQFGNLWNDNKSWSTDNNPYFSFVVLILHMNNYRLYSF
jgi:hypothetical protein